MQLFELKKEFDKIKEDWIDLLWWTSPYKVPNLTGNPNDKRRDNHHIVDPSHLLSRRAFVSGFMEGNTSSTRQWGLLETGDDDLNQFNKVKEFTQKVTRKVFNVFSSSNVYRTLPNVYESVSSVDTATLYIDELPTGLHFTQLEEGTYFVENDFKGDAVVLMREFTLSVRQVVTKYGLDNVSKNTKKLYSDGKYLESVKIVEWCGPNEFFDVEIAPVGRNRRWVCLTYEPDSVGGKDDKDFVFLRQQFRRRKPFIVPKNASSNNFAYGQTGCMRDAIGLVKSLNLKALSKDEFLDRLVNGDPVTGPASLKKAYMSAGAGGYVPMSATEQLQGGLKQVESNRSGYQLLDSDVSDLRRMIGKLFYEDYLLFMANNPKTRTAREVDVIEQEKQLIAGPLLQSLDHSLNVPMLEYGANYVLDTDPSIEVPEELSGKSLQVKVTSLFAQVQRAADLPQVDRFVQMMMQVAQIDPNILKKVDLFKYADIYADRLYLPAGLSRDQGEVDAAIEQEQAMQQRNQQIEQAMNMAKAQQSQAAANVDNTAVLQQGANGQQ